MKKFQNWMEKYIGPIAAKLSASKSMNAIAHGFSTILPITMVGSITCLFLYFSYFNFQEILVNIGVRPYITLIINLTTNAISVYLVFAVAYARARYDYDETEAKVLAILSELTFLLLLPMTDGNLTLDWLGAKGMFTGLICALTVIPLYKVLTEKGMVIKMPDSVPPFIADSFKAIVPAFLFAILCCVINALVQAAGLNSFPQMITTLLGAPFQVLSGNILTWLLLTVLTQLFWFFGIHGGMTVGNMFTLLWSEAALENIAAAEAGIALPNILTTGFGYLCSAANVWFSAVIVLIFFTKREDLRTIGKLSFFPTIFSITEPLRFGLPLVLNPTLFIPAVFISPLNNLLSYVVVSLGLVGRPRIAGISNVPIWLDALAMGGVSAFIYALVIFVIDIILWFPFIKLYEKQKNEEDAQLTKE